jgi:hypothetical protein
MFARLGHLLGRFGKPALRSRRNPLIDDLFFRQQKLDHPVNGLDAANGRVQPVLGENAKH